MAIYIEIVKAKDESPVAGVKVELQYTDGTGEAAVTAETGLAAFARSGAFTLTIDGRRYPDSLALEDEETLTVPLEGSKSPRWRRWRKIHLHSLNPQPTLLANQPSQRQVSLQVQAPAPRLNRRRPILNLGLVIDCSSSMAGDKIYTAVEGAVHLLQNLHPDDRVAVITFSHSAQVLLPGRQLNPAAREELVEQLGRPNLDQESNLYAGWQAGVDQVAGGRGENTLDRVLLLTDGLADAGLTDPVALVARAREFREQGIFTDIFGLGDDADLSLLPGLAQAGGGEFYRVETPNSFPAQIKRWWGPLDAAVQIGREAVVALTIPIGVQVELSLPHNRQGQVLYVRLGGIYAGQAYPLPLRLHLPAYPAGQTICLPAELRYQDAQNYPLPVVSRCLPICFLVQPETRRDRPAEDRPPASLQPQPAPVRPWLNPVWVALSGGMLFLMTAAVVVGTLLLMPAPRTPVTSAGVTPAAPVLAAVTGPAAPAPTSGELSPPPASATPVPIPTRLATAADVLALPTVTPTAPPLESPPPTVTRPPARPVAGLGLGNIAPDFTLGSNRASRVSLSELHGKIVILNFWTTWCPYSTREVPDLQAIHNEYGPQGVVVLAVNQGETLQNVERFAQANGVSFAVWLDEDEWAGNVYQIQSYPTTYFIDRDGIIRAVYRGARTRDQFLADLNKLLD